MIKDRLSPVFFSLFHFENFHHETVIGERIDKIILQKGDFAEHIELFGMLGVPHGHGNVKNAAGVGHAAQQRFGKIRLIARAFVNFYISSVFAQRAPYCQHILPSLTY